MSARFLRVHAVEDTAVQLTWAGLPARRVVVGVGPRSVVVDAAPPAWRHLRTMGSRPITPWPAGPGAVVVDGLEPATTYPVWLREPGRSRIAAGRVTTLRPPPGELLSRFATVSDLHIGERRFGAFGAIVDGPPLRGGTGGPCGGGDGTTFAGGAIGAASGGSAEPYPVRCARAALDEARAWGATVVALKGDLTCRSRPAELAVAAEIVAGSGLRPLVQMGNHDTGRSLDPGSVFGADVSFGGRVVVADLPGVRLVLGDSPVPGHKGGQIDEDQLGAIVAAVAEAEGPAVLALHHAPTAWPVPLSYPPGVRREDSRRLLAGLHRANPATIVLAGHSHRNRTYRVDGTLVSEVGSTKDFPGGWGGYAVHEGGIRQVVMRTARPDVMAWTEATSAALGGIWGLWSPGRLSDRCWSSTWADVARRRRRRPAGSAD